jgi:hypothetical protein
MESFTQKSRYNEKKEINLPSRKWKNTNPILNQLSSSRKAEDL